MRKSKDSLKDCFKNVNIIKSPLNTGSGWKSSQTNMESHNTINSEGLLSNLENDLQSLLFP